MTRALWAGIKDAVAHLFTRRFAAWCLPFCVLFAVSYAMRGCWAVRAL